MSNISKYKSTYVKYNVGNDKLLEILGDNLAKSPASQSENMHFSYEGGLVDYLLQVAANLIKLNTIRKDEFKYPIETLMKVGLLSEIGRVGMYKPTTWTTNKIGRNYDFTDDRTSLRVGQKTIYYIQKAGMILTEDEYSSLINLDSLVSDSMVNYHNSDLGDMLKMATMLTVMNQRLLRKTL